MKLLSVNSDYKTRKGTNKGYLTGILYLAPSNMVKGINTCKFASKGCRQACLFTAGRGIMKPVKNGRIRKTVLFRDNINGFMYQLIKDIAALKRKAKRENLIPVVRLNGTSDISWENVIHSPSGKNIMQLFSKVQFYDYTVNPLRKFDSLPANYHLTFSRKESNAKAVNKIASKGVNVAVVFNKVPSTYLGKEVVNGDETDLRFLDKSNVIVGLKAKGKARKDLTGFVVNN